MFLLFLEEDEAVVVDDGDFDFGRFRRRFVVVLALVLVLAWTGVVDVVVGPFPALTFSLTEPPA